MLADSRKFRIPGIIIIFCITEGKTGQNRFAEIMVAPTGINAVSGFQRTENGRFFSGFDPSYSLSKNIAGNTDQIRIFGVDLLQEVRHVFSDTVTEMNVCEQDDLQESIPPPACLFSHHKFFVLIFH